jgi:hypothetical protein
MPKQDPWGLITLSGSQLCRLTNCLKWKAVFPWTNFEWASYRYPRKPASSWVTVASFPSLNSPFGNNCHCWLVLLCQANSYSHCHMHSRSNTGNSRPSSPHGKEWEKWEMGRRERCGPELETKSHWLTKQSMNLPEDQLLCWTIGMRYEPGKDRFCPHGAFRLTVYSRVKLYGAWTGIVMTIPYSNQYKESI